VIASALLAEWYEVAGIVIAVPVALAIVWAIVRAVGHLTRVHEAIIGRPETSFSEAIPSMIERFHSIDDRFATVDLHLSDQDASILVIEAEFTTNGGSTVKDDLKKLQSMLDSVATRQAETARLASTAVDKLDAATADRHDIAEAAR
jgi:hypothetical protein